MAATITFAAPTAGGPNNAPISAGGTITGQLGALITAACGQTDQGLLTPVIPFGTTLPASPVAWALTIPAQAIPIIGNWYTLTIYAWDTVGDCSTASVTFQRTA